MNREERNKRIDSLDDLKRIRYNTHNTDFIHTGLIMAMMLDLFAMLFFTLFLYTFFKPFLGYCLFTFVLSIFLLIFIIYFKKIDKKKQEDYLLKYGKI